jgi:aminoglycoside phosphotransferase (APT) family kinase protein
MTRQPWEADFEIDEVLAKALIQRAAPELMPFRIEPFGAGWDNTAFLVDGRYVFRFPRRAIAIPLIEAEMRILPEIAGRLTVAVPAPRFIGEPSDAFPRPFVGYELVQGESACGFDLSDDERGSLVEPLADFLKRLHGAADLKARVDAPGDDFGRLNLPVLREKLSAGLAAIEGQIDSVFLKMARGMIDRPFDFQPGERTLVHGDLYARHLLLRQVGAGSPRALELTGVIDWGDVHLNDPCVDLVIVWTFLPVAHHRRFFARYGPIGAASAWMARLRALQDAILLHRYGHEGGEPDLARESRFIFRNLNRAWRGD